MGKSRLGIVLSGLKGFSNPKVSAEQYETDSEVGSMVIWQAKMLGDMGKVSVDMGCGTGILGIGGLLVGGGKMYFVESDGSALDIAKENWAKVESEYKVEGEAVFLHKDIKDFDKKVDVVLQNPPFGTKVRNSDKKFLEKAIKIGKVIYSFHKTETEKFIRKYCEGKGCKVTHVWRFSFPLKAKYAFHRRGIHRINVSCFRISTTNEKK